MSQHTIRFNTGRPYGIHGQRIAARQLKDGRVFFADVTRGIDYVTDAPCELEPAAIMRAYDAGACSAPFWAIQNWSAEDVEAVTQELRVAARAVA